LRGTRKRRLRVCSLRSYGSQTLATRLSAHNRVGARRLDALAARRILFPSVPLPAAAALASTILHIFSADRLCWLRRTLSLRLRAWRDESIPLEVWNVLIDMVGGSSRWLASVGGGAVGQRVLLAAVPSGGKHGATGQRVTTSPGISSLLTSRCLTNNTVLLSGFATLIARSAAEGDGGPSRVNLQRSRDWAHVTARTLHLSHATCARTTRTHVARRHSACAWRTGRQLYGHRYVVRLAYRAAHNDFHRAAVAAAGGCWRFTGWRWRRPAAWRLKRRQRWRHGYQRNNDNCHLPCFMRYAQTFSAAHHSASLAQR